ncbi:hypothetical protein ALNOE001_00710 [Candidatus Methanobinarius endosymbioticus]|uniref:Uncharacterized protein n=1 Tax=Candidatus Methanobinarius endosymbioticus TaxID=2006182 RepID=A0A366MGI2_9EURY|nr:hypothetical protein ALNOE001_00710 [Candidatus Methanobinarius endosymbioticus]
MINEEEAQVIASRYIEEKEAVAGIPRLKEVRADLLIYIVPVLVNDIPKGEIHIHSETGENLGGAGC